MYESIVVLLGWREHDRSAIEQSVVSRRVSSEYLRLSIGLVGSGEAAVFRNPAENKEISVKPYHNSSDQVEFQAHQSLG